MTVIAEGVESYEEHAHLQAATNIRYAQGYYFSKSLLLEQAPAFIEAIHPTRQPEDIRAPSGTRWGMSRLRQAAR